MRLGRRVARFLFWGLVLCFSLPGRAVSGSRTGISRTAKRSRESSASTPSAIFRRAILDPGRVRPSLRAGELAFHDLKLRQAIDGDVFETLRIPFLQLQVNPRKLAEGKFEPSRDHRRPAHARGCDAGRTEPGTSRGCLLIPGPGRGSKRRRSRSVTARLSSIPAKRSASEQPRTDAMPARRAQPPSAAVPPRQPAPHRPSPIGRLRRPESRHPARRQSQDRARRQGPGQSQVRRLRQRRRFRASDVHRQRSISKPAIIELGGELVGAGALREPCAASCPPGRGAPARRWHSTGGVVDLKLNRLLYNPANPPESRLRCNMVARLREGVWECPELPFPVNDLSAVVSVEEHVVTIKHARGTNGNTTLTADGVIVAGRRQERLDGSARQSRRPGARRRPPSQAEPRTNSMELWDLFKPKGSVNVDLHVARAMPLRRSTGPPGSAVATSRRSIGIFAILWTTSPAI